MLGAGLFFDFDDLVALLPPDLVALRLSTGGNCSAADVRALLSRCLRLRALDLSCNGDAVEYLAGGSLVDRPLLLGFHHLPAGTDGAALTAAGHRVGELRIKVDWRIPGGVVFNGKAAWV